MRENIQDSMRIYCVDKMLEFSKIVHVLWITNIFYSSYINEHGLAISTFVQLVLGRITETISYKVQS